MTKVGQCKTSLKYTGQEDVCGTCYRNGLCAFVHVAKPLNRWVGDCLEKVKVIVLGLKRLLLVLL